MLEYQNTAKSKWPLKTWKNWWERLRWFNFELIQKLQIPVRCKIRQGNGVIILPHFSTDTDEAVFEFQLGGGGHLSVQVFSPTHFNLDSHIVIYRIISSTREAKIWTRFQINRSNTHIRMDFQHVNLQVKVDWEAPPLPCHCTITTTILLHLTCPNKCSCRIALIVIVSPSHPALSLYCPLLHRHCIALTLP